MSTVVNIRSSKKRKLCTPHVLPCKIIHDGPANVARFFKPTTRVKSNHAQVFFRGRQFIGQSVHVPDGFTGIVVPSKPIAVTDPDDSHNSQPGDEYDEQLHEWSDQARFDCFVVWDHDHLPDDADPHLESVREWISFATTLHS
ncbi:ribonuclease H2, subunit C [Lipomyces japonicus]|uniref:ribonuclease H2, subunit C n=1 Tax=Lipomyces japonicus TaxID=56871 RepID=UPI0034CDC593